MVITDVLVHQPFQMPFIENDYVVEHVPAAVADPAFRNAVLHGLWKLVRFGWIPQIPAISRSIPPFFQVCCYRLFNKTSYCRRARFSKNRSRRERKEPTAMEGRSPSKRNMRPILY